MRRIVVGFLLMHGVIVSSNIKLALQLAARLPRTAVSAPANPSVAKRLYQSPYVARSVERSQGIPSAKQPVLQQDGIERAKKWFDDNKSIISQAAIAASRNGVPLETALLDADDVASPLNLEGVFRQTLPGVSLLPSPVSLSEIQRLVNNLVTDVYLVRDRYREGQAKMHVAGERLAQQWFDRNKALLNSRLQDQTVPYESLLISDEQAGDIRLLDRALRQHIPNMTQLSSQVSLQDVQRLVNNYVHELYDHQLATRMHQEEQAAAQARQERLAQENAQSWFAVNRSTLATVFNRMRLYSMESLHWIQTRYMANLNEVFYRLRDFRNSNSFREALTPLPQPCDNQVLMGLIHGLIREVYEEQVERHRVSPRLEELNKQIDEGQGLTVGDGREYISLSDQYSQHNTDRYRRILYWLKNKTGEYSMHSSARYFDPHIQIKKLQDKIDRGEGLSHFEVGQYMNFLKDVHRDYSGYRGAVYYDGQEDPIENQTVSYGTDVGLYNSLNNFFVNPRKKNKKFHGNNPSDDEKLFDELRKKVRNKEPMTYAEVREYISLSFKLGEMINDIQAAEMIDWLDNHSSGDMYPEAAVAQATQADVFFHGQKVEGDCPVCLRGFLEDGEEGVGGVENIVALQPCNHLICKECRAGISEDEPCPMCRGDIIGVKTSVDVNA